ncbi:MAG: hypothetical protein HY047_16625 [Acidobacteria bacterium]|nr:hypothetical protein [Acidobacteriota bacterium]
MRLAAATVRFAVNNQVGHDCPMQISAPVWIIIALGIIALISVLAVFAKWPDVDDSDLGSVSNQWVAEHRGGQSHESAH